MGGGAWESGEERSRCAVRHSQEAEAVGELVEKNCNEVNGRAVVIVEAQIKRNAGQTARLPQVRIKSRADSGGSWIQIRSEDRGSMRVVIPSTWKWRTLKTPKTSLWPPLPQT